MEDMVIKEFWKGKRVFITGHTGFKGAWLSLWLCKAGASLYGYALDPPTTPSLYELASVSDLMIKDTRGNICDITALRDAVHIAQPDIIFHLAAQALVRKSYKEPVETFATNIMGTTNLLDILRDLESAKVAVMITTDKVYRNNEWYWPYREEDILGGHDPYSASKAACEIVIESYRKSFFSDRGVALASARAGNVIGGGDWAQDRLIPDAIRAWQQGETLQIRNPEAVRPWQHVLEPLSGYIALANYLWEKPELAGAYNFGPNTNEGIKVRTVVDIAKEAYGNGCVKFGENTEVNHEAEYLTLEIAKARRLLGFNPIWTIGEAIERTMHWYQSQYHGSDARNLCYKDIVDYEAVQ
jgi:CDP-glucose 4,6-dehydratase